MKRIGLSHGCFDLLHEGHLHFLAQAAAECDYLIVAVNHDDSVARLKGGTSPVQNLEERMWALLSRASHYIGALIPFNGAKRQMLGMIQPDVYILGHDQGEVGIELLCRDLECDMVRASHLPGYSTSLQIERARLKTDA